VLNHSLRVPNSLAAESSVCGIFQTVDEPFIQLIKSNEINPKPLLICSGGTSTQCAANGHWTLDLRKNYQKVKFDPASQEIEIEAGVPMGKLLDELSKHKRSFPTGLSPKTGLGYILTGGISPISRSRGLAIDQIKKIKGIWGTGEVLDISKPNNFSSKEDKLIWKGLTGAAHFLSIVTSITLKTYEEKPLYICSEFISPDELAESIYQSESWPNFASLQWIWADKIKAYVVIELESNEAIQMSKNLIKELPFGQNPQISIIEGLKDIPKFSLPELETSNPKRIHSEVIGLLGKGWGKESKSIVKSLNSLISKRPNNHCYIASQQLGGVTKEQDSTRSSFIYRDSIWKPWINGAWQSGDLNARSQSLSWMEEVWGELETLCPGVHLAQLHPHLPWHKKEINMAYLDWLPGLQNLKSIYDPEGLLPPL
tara:strand:+ start:830 stop:2110 length:1281 start_codon:yes stop_codon:yes gene_type:complete